MGSVYALGFSYKIPEEKAMKKDIVFFILFVLLTLLCGCQDPVANDLFVSDSSVSGSQSYERNEMIYQFNRPFIKGAKIGTPAPSARSFSTTLPEF